jgi:RNA polymerase primary sigma factor
MKIAPEDIEGLEILNGKEVSLSSKYFDESIEIGDKIKDDITPSVEYQIIKNSIEQQIRNLLNELDEREALVIRLRFGLDDDKSQTLQEIGDKLKLTRERIRQIEQRAMRKLSRSHKLQQLRGYLN